MSRSPAFQASQIPRPPLTPSPRPHPQHLHDNIRSLEIKLTAEQIAKIDSVQEFEHGFPSNFCGTDPTMNPIEGQPRNRLIAASGTLDFLPGPKPFGLA